MHHIGTHHAMVCITYLWYEPNVVTMYFTPIYWYEFHTFSTSVDNVS